MASESSSSSRRGRQFLTSHGQFRFGTCGLLLGALALAACSDEARHLSATESDDASGTEPDGTSGTEPDGTASELVSGVKLGVYGDNNLRTNGDEHRYGNGKQVLRQEGDRLYALSGNEGLAVLDLSDPSAPRIAGRHWSLSSPFELLAEDGIVLALHDGWQTFVCEQGSESCDWRSASRLQALDTRDATQIALLSDLSIPGALRAVQRTGNVLYVVTEEQECWGCEAERNYTVTSFDVLDPANLHVLDQLRFFTRWNAPGPVPIFVPGAQRLYISNPDADPRDPSSVQIVDISDPGGALVEGARFDVQAALLHPSQLQEEGGILRIVNWPAGAINSEVQPPIAQAFRVSSSSDVQAAGSLRVQVEEPRFQGNVRWQGTRAYLSMFRQVIALDLDNPDQPQQVVTLDLPGSVYGMEPLGDRLLVVSDEAASLFSESVQLRSFDVSTLAQPTLLDTETLDGAVRSEDSPYTFLPEQGLIALPLNGGNFECHYPAGISLFDLDSSGLLQRGVIADTGNASLLFRHRERLFGVGERHIETFDIDDRDAPSASGRLDLIHPASAVQALGEDLLVVGRDFASGRTLLQVMPPPASQGIASQSMDAVPLGKLPLGLLDDARDCTERESALGSELFSKGEHIYVPFVGPMRNAANSLAITLRHVDVSDRAAPRLVGELQLGEDALGSIYYRLLQQTDHALLVGLSHSQYVQGAQVEVTFFDILDLSNPAQPQLASRFDLPAALQPGWGEIPGGVTLEQRGRWRDAESRALLTDGNLLITQHRVPVAERSSAAAYYLDRLDLSDPYQPRLLPAINIPGAVVYFNQQTGDVLTFDTEPTTESTSIGARTLHWLSVSGDRAEEKGQVALDGERRLHAFAVSQNNIFYTTVGAANDVLLEALRLESGQLLHLPAVALPRSHVASATLFAQGSRAFDVAHDRLTVIDLLDPDAPRLTTPSLPHWPCDSLQLSGNTLYCADRVRGVDRIDLSTAP